MRTRLLLLVLSMLLVSCQVQINRFEVVNNEGPYNCTSTGVCDMRVLVLKDGRPLTGYTMTDAAKYFFELEVSGPNHKDKKVMALDKALTTGYGRVDSNGYFYFKHTFPANGEYDVSVRFFDLKVTSIFERMRIPVVINPCYLGNLGTGESYRTKCGDFGVCVAQGLFDYACDCIDGFANPVGDDKTCVPDLCAGQDCDGHGFCEIEEVKTAVSGSSYRAVCECFAGYVHPMYHHVSGPQGGRPTAYSTATSAPSIIQVEGFLSPYAPLFLPDELSCQQTYCYDEDGYASGTPKYFVTDFNVYLEEQANGQGKLLTVNIPDYSWGCFFGEQERMLQSETYGSNSIVEIMKRDYVELQNYVAEVEGENGITQYKNTHPLTSFYMGESSLPASLPPNAAQIKHASFVNDEGIVSCEDYVYQKYYMYTMWLDVAAETADDPLLISRFAYSNPQGALNDRIRFGGRLLMGALSSVVAEGAFFRDIRPFGNDRMVPNNIFVKTKIEQVPFGTQAQANGVYIDSFYRSNDLRWHQLAVSLINDNAKWKNYFQGIDPEFQRIENKHLDFYRNMRHVLLDLLVNRVLFNELRFRKMGLPFIGSDRMGAWLADWIKTKKETGEWPAPIQALVDTYTDVDTELPNYSFTGAYPANVLIESWETLTMAEKSFIEEKLAAGLRLDMTKDSSAGNTDLNDFSDEHVQEILFEIDAAIYDVLEIAGNAGCLAANEDTSKEDLRRLCSWLPEEFVDPMKEATETAVVYAKPSGTNEELSEEEITTLCGDSPSPDTCEKEWTRYQGMTVKQMMQSDYRECMSKLPEETNDPFLTLSLYNGFHCIGHLPAVEKIEFNCTDHWYYQQTELEGFSCKNLEPELWVTAEFIMTASNVLVGPTQNGVPFEEQEEYWVNFKIAEISENEHPVFKGALDEKAWKEEMRALKHTANRTIAPLEFTFARMIADDNPFCDNYFYFTRRCEPGRDFNEHVYQDDFENPQVCANEGYLFPVKEGTTPNYVVSLESFEDYLSYYDLYRRYAMGLLMVRTLREQAIAALASHGKEGFNGKDGSYGASRYGSTYLGSDEFNIHFGYAYGWGVNGFRNLKDFIRDLEDWDLNAFMGASHILDGYVGESGSATHEMIISDYCKRIGQGFAEKANIEQEDGSLTVQQCMQEKYHELKESGCLIERSGGSLVLAEDGLKCMKENGFSYIECTDEEAAGNTCAEQFKNMALTPYLYGYFGAGATIFGKTVSMHNATTFVEKEMAGIAAELSGTAKKELEQAMRYVTDPAAEAVSKVLGQVKGALGQLSTISSNTQAPQISLPAFPSASSMSGTIQQEQASAQARLKQAVLQIQDALNDIFALAKEMKQAATSAEHKQEIEGQIKVKLYEMVYVLAGQSSGNGAIQDLCRGVVDPLRDTIAAEFDNAGVDSEAVEQVFAGIEEYIGSLSGETILAKMSYACPSEDDPLRTIECDSKKLLSNVDIEIGRFINGFAGEGGSVLEDLISGALLEVKEGMDDWGVTNGEGYSNEAFEVMAYLKLNPYGRIPQPTDSDPDALDGEIEGLQNFYYAMDNGSFYRLHIYRLGDFIYQKDGSEGMGKDLMGALSSSFSPAELFLRKYSEIVSPVVACMKQQDINNCVPGQVKEMLVSQYAPILDKLEGFRRDYHSYLDQMEGNEKKAFSRLLKDLSASDRHMAQMAKQAIFLYHDQPKVFESDFNNVSKNYPVAADLIKEIVVSQLSSFSTCETTDGTADEQTCTAAAYEQETDADYAFITRLGSYDLGFATAEIRAGIYLNYDTALSVDFGTSGQMVPFTIGEDEESQYEVKIPFASSAQFAMKVEPHVKLWANAEGSISIDYFIVSAQGTLGIDIDILEISLPFEANFGVGVEWDQKPVGNMKFEYFNHRPFLGVDASLHAIIDILPRSEIYASANIEILGIEIFDTGRVVLFKDVLPFKKHYDLSLLSVPEAYRKIYLDDLFYIVR